MGSEVPANGSCCKLCRSFCMPCSQAHRGSHNAIGILLDDIIMLTKVENFAFLRVVQGI